MPQHYHQHDSCPGLRTALCRPRIGVPPAFAAGARSRGCVSTYPRACPTPGSRPHVASRPRSRRAAHPIRQSFGDCRGRDRRVDLGASNKVTDFRHQFWSKSRSFLRLPIRLSAASVGNSITAQGRTNKESRKAGKVEAPSSCIPGFFISSFITLLNAKDDSMNFSDLQVWHYAIAGCAVLLLLAIILYFLPGGRINVSGTAACALVSLVVGFGVGILTMFAFGFHWEGEPTPKQAAASRMGGMGGGGPPGGGAPGGGKGEGGGEGKKGGSEKKGKDSDFKGESGKKAA